MTEKVANLSNNLRRHFLRAAFGVAAMVLAAPCALAEFPEKPIRIIVPFTAGSGTDFNARLLAEGLEKELKQSVVVDNRAGADGIIGTRAGASAAPDGYTLVITASATHSSTPALVKDLSYDPVKDFTHLSMIVEDIPLVLVVHPDGPKTLDEFIKLAKSKKLKFAYGSNSSLVGAAAFNKLTGITDATPVPYKSQPPAATDVAGGQVDYLFADATATGPFITAGKLRPLALTGPKRLAHFPDIKTLDEQGYKGYDLQVWVGIAGPANMPPDIAKKLSDAIRAALNREDIKKKFSDVGKTAAPNTMEEQAAIVVKQMASWAKRIQEAGLKGQ